MRLFTVDAFTNEAFKGNPAGVCILDAPFEDEANYLKISQEINYAETAFVYPKGDYFKLRWFTPTTEVELCGHATLATAKILFEKYSYSKNTINFDTLSGILSVQKEGDLLIMDFPMEKIEETTEIPSFLISFLKQKPKSVYTDRHWHIIPLEKEDDVLNFIPDLSLINHQPLLVVITAQSNSSKYDFVSRVFAPYFGISEDPVTGSAHCYLANFWSKQLQQNSLKGFQASQRTGEVFCEIISKNRVLLKGNAIIMSELLIDWEL